MLENLIAITPIIDNVVDFSFISNRENRRLHRRIEREFGLQCLGFGVTRVAFRLGDYVLKLGSPRHNEAEWGVWSRYSASQAATVLTPCYHISEHKTAIIQKFAGETASSKIASGEFSYEKLDTLRERIIRVLSDEGVDFADLHPGNISVDGLVLDYGHFR